MSAIVVMFCAVPLFSLCAAAVVYLIFNKRLPGMWRL